ncbi:transposase [Nonomuraea deserti]|uniref:Transposase n=1 Tax=Nonomuraea deserti TaxID=1848322 RepID=A0A4R4VNX2_9ACTN|nr:transposase [Nonomuraea deserti]
MIAEVLSTHLGGQEPVVVCLHAHVRGRQWLRFTGCRCHSRKPSYPSDLTDAEWTVLEVEARAAMAELVATTGRPMVHDLRAVLDAINYVTRYGIDWRALPVDFPSHEAVYGFFLRWSRRGLPERLAGRLRGRLRVMAGRDELPTAACIDSQTVKAAETVGATACGFDAGNYEGLDVMPGAG